MHWCCASACYPLEGSLMLKIILSEDQAGSQAYWTWSSKKVSFPRRKRLPWSVVDGGKGVAEKRLQFSCGPTLCCIHIMNDVWKEKGFRNQASICTKDLFYTPTPAVPFVLVLHNLPQWFWLEPTSPDTKWAYRKGFKKIHLKNPEAVYLELSLWMAMQSWEMQDTSKFCWEKEMV